MNMTPSKNQVVLDRARRAGQVKPVLIGTLALIAVAGAAWYFLSGETGRGVPGGGVGGQRAGIAAGLDLQVADRVPNEGPLSDCSLLLITLDTTRADHLGCYGNGTIQTPTLDRLATEGVIFSAAIAVAPLTLPTHTTILTGLYPPHHGVRTNGFFRLQDDQETLAERLNAEGFKTAALPSAFVLDSQFGLAQGFDHYDDELTEVDASHDENNPSRRADHTTDRAIEWLEGVAPERFFLWVHYFDPHYVYSAPSPFKERYAKTPYDGEIAYVDAQMTRLLSSVEDLGWKEKCLTVVIGDHGEGLGEHNEPTHAYQVYDSTLRIPFLMHCGSRLGGGLHITRPVSQVDVMPTVLSLLGLGAKESDGWDLTQSIPASRPLFFETLAGTFEYGWEPLVGVSIGSHKYIHSSKSELYDLAQDPGELQNILANDGDKVAQLKHELHNLLGPDLELAFQVATTVTPSSGDLENLQALGYLGGGATNQSTSTLRGLPQEMITLLNRVELARNRQITFEERIAELNAVLAEQPEFYPALKALGQLYVGHGDLERGGKALADALNVSPGTPRDVFGLAAVRHSQGRLDEALGLLQPLLQQYPDYLRAHQFYGTILSAQGKWDEAIEHFQWVFHSDPDFENWMNTKQLAAALTKTGQSARLEQLFREHLEQVPSSAGVRQALAAHLAQSKRERDAVSLLREGLQLYPADSELVNTLSLLLITSQDPEILDINGAVNLLIPFAAEGAEVPELMFTLCTIYGQTGRGQEAIEIATRARAIAAQEGNTKLVNAFDRNLGK